MVFRINLPVVPVLRIPKSGPPLILQPIIFEPATALRIAASPPDAPVNDTSQSITLLRAPSKDIRDCVGCARFQAMNDWGTGVRRYCRRSDYSGSC
jgi:hypothetical protein